MSVSTNDPVEELRARVASLEQEAAAAEHESRELAEKVRVAERLLEEVGRVPRGWRLTAAFGGLALAFWAGAFYGFDVWWFGAMMVLSGAMSALDAGAAERKAWQRIERARLEPARPAVRVEHGPPEEAVALEEVDDAVSRRQHRP